MRGRNPLCLILASGVLFPCAVTYPSDGGAPHRSSYAPGLPPCFLGHLGRTHRCCLRPPASHSSRVPVRKAGGGQALPWVSLERQVWCDPAGFLWAAPGEAGRNHLRKSSFCFSAFSQHPGRPLVYLWEWGGLQSGGPIPTF